MGTVSATELMRSLQLANFVKISFMYIHGNERKVTELQSFLLCIYMANSEHFLLDLLNPVLCSHTPIAVLSDWRYKPFLILPH